MYSSLVTRLGVFEDLFDYGSSEIPVLNSLGIWIIGLIVSLQALQEFKDRAYVIFAATCYVLWRYRNNVTFNS